MSYKFYCNIKWSESPDETRMQEVWSLCRPTATERQQATRWTLMRSAAVACIRDVIVYRQAQIHQLLRTSSQSSRVSKRRPSVMRRSSTASDHRSLGPLGSQSINIRSRDDACGRQSRRPLSCRVHSAAQSGRRNFLRSFVTSEYMCIRSGNKWFGNAFLYVS